MNTNEIVISEEIRNKSKHPCPAGTHNGVCAAVYDLGKQKSANGWPDRRKLALIFEVEARISEGPLTGQPYRISRLYSATLNDKSGLTGALKAWFGYDPRKIVNGRVSFSPSSLVGKPCMLTVTHKTTPDGDVMPVVMGVTAHMKGLPELVSAFDASKVPEWIAKMQAQSLDRQELHGQPDQAGAAVPQQLAGVTAVTEPQQETAENPPLVVEETVAALDITADWLSA